MTEPEMNEKADLALALLEKGDLAGAKDLYQQICHTNEIDPDAWVMLGAINGELGNFGEAVSCLQKAVTLQPDHLEAHINLGNIQRMQGNLPSALACFQRVTEIDPRYAEAWMMMGGISGMMGMYDKAETYCRHAIALQPDSVDAYMNLANTLLQAGKLADAIANYQMVIKLRPNLPTAWLMLGRTCLQSGNASEAESCYRRAIALQPDFADAHLALGASLRARNKAAEAGASYREALRFNPDLAEAYYGLGLSLEEAKQYDQAIMSYRNALRLKPDYAEAYLRHARISQLKGDYQESVSSYQQALRIQPNNAEIYHRLAAAFELDGKQDQAVRYYQKALQLMPEFIEAHIGLGSALLSLGKPYEALACCEQAFRIQPAQIDAISLATNITLHLGDKQKAQEYLAPLIEAGVEHGNVALAFGELSRGLGREQEAITMMERLLDSQQSLTAATTRNLHFGLGKLYDSMGDYDKAFDHYRMGNDSKAHGFDAKKYALEVDTMITLHSADFMAQMPRASIRSDRPIFIVGMVRSGTSLVEQILASHPSVYGAGELPDIIQTALSLHSMLGTDLLYPLCLPLLTEDKINTITRRYLDGLAGLSPAAVRVVDKMPGNFMHLGLIELLFPDARVIHCTRDPMDTCLSAYFQNFSISNYYSYNLSSLGLYYGEYRKIMQHWKKVLRIPMLDIQYEELVANQEPVSKKIIEFCGLEWDDRCLRFHETRRFVGTASHDQVRRPLYNKSVARWKNYEKYLNPLREALEKQSE